MIVLLGFAFISGLVTILAPCIWPLLPIILSSSIAGKGHKRPLGITLGIMLSFMIFTLSVSYLVSIFHLDPNMLRVGAVIVLIILGLTMLVPYFSKLFEILVSRMSGMFAQNSNTQSNGFWGGFITGLSLGIVWSPCAGPILASIAALAATGEVTFQLFLVTLSYVIGVGIPLFAFAYGGQKFITGTRSLSAYTGRIQQVFGIFMILTAMAIYTNYDKVIQIKLLNAFPQFGTALNGFESNGLVTKELSKLKGQDPSSAFVDNGDLFNENKPAPELKGITKWLNPEEAVSMADLKGKVILVDFWTYTCINCIRTLPHVTSWYEKYKDKGFVVIGVHTPEFAFEKETNNVLSAIEQYKIHYPVAQDNDFSTWRAFNNQYWPAEYLIDAKGIIRRTHFGEGEYDQMEQAIQLLLKETGQVVSDPLSKMPDETPIERTSPETYIGSSRMENLFPGKSVKNGNKDFVIENKTPVNNFSFGGNWEIMSEYSTAFKDASLQYNFKAKKVFLVMKTPDGKPHRVSVMIDNQLISGEIKGVDVVDGIVTVDKDRLYELVDFKKSVESHTLKLQFLDPGVQVFAFTFGS